MERFRAGSVGWMPWLRTNGVNTNGAAAKVMNFDKLWKKVCEIDRFVQIGIQKSVDKCDVHSDTISADPILSLSEYHIS